MAPITPEIGKALVSAGGSVLGGLFGGLLGNKAQSNANKTNLQIARETNKTNLDIALQANALTRQMQQEQMKYASPSEQRRMLEEAGYNPYLYGSQSAHPSSSPAAAVGNAMVAPTLQPVNALANNISSMTIDAANVFKLIAEGKKASAEAAGQNLQNDVFMEQFEQNMRLLGLEEDYNAIRNSYENQKQSLNMEILQSEKLLNDQKLADLKLTYEIRQYYKDNIQPQELQKIIKEVHLLEEQGKTQENLRNYYDAMSKAGIIGSNAQMLLAKIEDFYKFNKNEMFGATATELNARAGSESQDYIYKGFQNDIMKLQGKEMAQAELRSIIKRGNLDEALSQQAYENTNYLKKAVSWYEYQQIVSGFKSVVGTGADAMMWMKILGL